ncbi:MAG: hypothetical protein QOJ15_5214 [Bradyrhizobium sp.]|jgi:hypothetical protein|nr:hypothetical protein [Bradyrhizobium sp.]
MQHERRDYDDDNLAEIWRSAQHRRSDDIYFWFTHFLETRRQLKSSGGETPSHFQSVHCERAHRLHVAHTRRQPISATLTQTLPITPLATNGVVT